MRDCRGLFLASGKKVCLRYRKTTRKHRNGTCTACDMDEKVQTMLEKAGMRVCRVCCADLGGCHAVISAFVKERRKQQSRPIQQRAKRATPDSEIVEAAKIKPKRPRLAAVTGLRQMQRESLLSLCEMLRGCDCPDDQPELRLAEKLDKRTTRMGSQGCVVRDYRHVRC